MQQPNRNRFRGMLIYIFASLALIGVFQMFRSSFYASPTKELTSSEFISQLKEGRYSSIELQIGSGTYNISGEYKSTTVEDNSQNFLNIFQGSKTARRFTTHVLGNDSTLAQITELAQASNTKFKTLPESSMGMWLSIIPYALMLIPLFFLMSMMQAGGGAGGRGIMNFGKTKTKDISKQNVKVGFDDVAGAAEEKQELVEVVEFLKDPKRFTDLGAKIPTGVLLEGPPGTGKTLLAKAVAGEAGVPFFSISGSEFVEMFVGVGASRVRDLFENAKKNAPAIIFIDEIDAVGRRRGTGMGGGNDEREQTLNQLLVEMDGFGGNEGVIVISATNRSDVLDPALLRPGRFDRKIMVGNPDVKAREEILHVHAKNKPLAQGVDLKVVAQQTPGFSGADLANLLNEAALIAARANKKVIHMSDINEAQDRIIAGLAKRDRQRTEKSNRIVAYHEAGHAVAGLVLDAANEVHKVTIVPRGRAAGYVISLPKEEQIVISKDELFNRVVGLLAGRAAEEIVFSEPSTGASNDFEQATSIVRAMVMKYGMSKKLGTIDYEAEITPGQGIQKLYSDHTAHEIDKEVIEIMERAHQHAHTILNENRDKLNLIAEKLLEFETIDGPAIKSLFETGEMPAKEDESDDTHQPNDATNEERPSTDEEPKAEVPSLRRRLEEGEDVIAQDDSNSNA